MLFLMNANIPINTIAFIGLSVLIFNSGITELFMLKKALIENYTQKLNIQNYSQQTVISYLSALNKFIDYIKLNQIKNNVVQKTRIIRYKGTSNLFATGIK